MPAVSQLPGKDEEPNPAFAGNNGKVAIDLNKCRIWISSFPGSHTLAPTQAKASCGCQSTEQGRAWPEAQTARIERAPTHQ